MPDRSTIAGVILAGGKASRMEFQDKPLLLLAGRPLIEHVVNRASPQVSTLLLSVNRNIQKFAYLGMPLIADAGVQFKGPLMGVYSAMCWLHERSATAEYARYSHIACFAGDVPCFPSDLVSRLTQGVEHSSSQVAIAATGAQLQPLFSLWSLQTMPVLREAISERLYGPKLILPRLSYIEIQFGETGGVDFTNINTSSDLATLESTLRNE